MAPLCHATNKTCVLACQGCFTKCSQNSFFFVYYSEHNIELLWKPSFKILYLEKNVPKSNNKITREPRKVAMGHLPKRFKNKLEMDITDTAAISSHIRFIAEFQTN